MVRPGSTSHGHDHTRTCERADEYNLDSGGGEAAHPNPPDGGRLAAANSMTVVVAAAGLIIGLLGIVLAMVAMSRARRMVAVTAKRIRSELAASGPLDPRAVRDVAVVRYDALEEMAGQLSFSVALLNSHGDGVVLTSINGRTETRTYAKVVADGKGVHQLSPEEQQAVRAAQLGHGPPTLLTQAPRLVGGHGPVRPATAADAERARTAAQRTSHGPADPDSKRAAAKGAADPDRRTEAADGQRSVSSGDGAKPGAPAGKQETTAAKTGAAEPSPKEPVGRQVRKGA